MLQKWDMVRFLEICSTLLIRVAPIINRIVTTILAVKMAGESVHIARMADVGSMGTNASLGSAVLHKAGGKFSPRMYFPFPNYRPVEVHFSIAMPKPDVCPSLVPAGQLTINVGEIMVGQSAWMANAVRGVAHGKLPLK